jgi:hypothetical protein
MSDDEILQQRDCLEDDSMCDVADLESHMNSQDSRNSDQDMNYPPSPSEMDYSQCSANIKAQIDRTQ